MSQDNFKKNMFHYTMCGLKNVYLENGYTCREFPDGETGVSIKDMDGLHKAIGLNIIGNSSSLSGDEIRFLRKEMGLSQKDMSTFVGASDSTYRNWENDRNPITVSADRLIRVIYDEFVHGDGHVLDLIKRISELNHEIATMKSKFSFVDTENGWLVEMPQAA